MSESFWKKEIRLRKRPEPLPPLPAHLLERSRVRVERPKDTVAVPVVPASDPLSRVERWTAPVPAPPVERPATVEFPKPAAGEGQDPVALLPARTAVDPAPHSLPAPLPAPAATYGWPKPAPAPVSDTEVSDTVSEPEPATVADEVAVPVAEEVSDTEVSDTVSEPEPATVAEDVAVPVADEVSDTAVSDTVSEPEPPAAEKVPLLKREVSLRRKPKAAKQPKAKKQKAPKPAPAEKTPLLKRDVVLYRRKPKAEKPVVEKQRTSPLKRELHLPRPSRRPKAAPGHKVQRVVGLRIGSSQLAAAHVQNNGHAEIVQIARVPIDRGLVVAGEVRDAEALTRALKEFFATTKLPRKDVRLGLASTRIGVRVLDVPALDDPKQFENALRFRAQELLPIPVTDAILDHVVLGEARDDEGAAVRRVLLVFAHRELVHRFVDVCRNAGVRLSGIDLDAFALLRALAPERAEDQAADRATVAVAVGNDRTILAVSDGRVCDYTRVLEWGGSSLDVALGRALNLAPSQAEPVKKLVALDGVDTPDGLTPVQFEAAKSALRAEIGVLGRELVSSLRFYQGREDSLPIGEILLAGGAAQLGGFPEELQRLLGATIRVADPFAGATLGKRIVETEATGSLAIAVGLGIER